LKINLLVNNYEHIVVKPIVTVARIIVSSENNSETELECLVHSDPPAKVNWTKDGADIVNNQRIQLISNQNKHNLVLKDLRDSDFGEYTCSAWNTIGASKKTIKLVKTPAILRCLKSRTDAKEMVLTWEVQSKSNISEHEFVYRRKGVSLILVEKQEDIKTYLKRAPSHAL
jgi:hypothetical protein